MNSGNPPHVPEEVPEVRVATSVKLRAKLKINNAPSEIIDAIAATILLSQPNCEMDFYELATAVFNAFEVEGVRRLAVTRHMLRFRHELEAARPNRNAWLQKRLEIGQRLVPSLVDASFMQFVLRMLSYSEKGLTEREIAECWLDHHISWFGDEYRDTVEALGSSMLDPVLHSLLARQDEWEIQLIQRIDPSAPDNSTASKSIPASSASSSFDTRQSMSSTGSTSSKGSTSSAGSTGATGSTSSTSSTGATGSDSSNNLNRSTSPSNSRSSSRHAGSITSGDSNAPTGSDNFTESTGSSADTIDTASSASSVNAAKPAKSTAEEGHPVDPSDNAIRWKSVAPFDNRKKAIIVPALMFENYPSSENHPVKGSLSYYLPPYNAFFLATPNAAEASLAARMLSKP